MQKELDEMSIGDIFKELRNIPPEFRASHCEVHGEYQEKGAYFLSTNIKWLGCQECKRIAKEAAEAKELQYMPFRSQLAHSQSNH